MTLQGPLLASGVPASETGQRLRRCRQLARQQGMLLIGIKGSGRVGQRREFYPVLRNESPPFGAHVSQKGRMLLLYMLTPSKRINKKKKHSQHLLVSEQ